MRNTIFLAILVGVLACNKSDRDSEASPENENIPVSGCIQEIIDERAVADETNLKIYGQLFDNQAHFWLNNGANSFDGDEPIVNSTCDTICYKSGWVPTECESNYDWEAWKLIWPNE